MGVVAECSVTDNVVFRDCWDEVRRDEDVVASCFSMRIRCKTCWDVNVFAPEVSVMSDVDPVVKIDDLVHPRDLFNVRVQVSCNNGGWRASLRVVVMNGIDQGVCP